MAMAAAVAATSESFLIISTSVCITNSGSLSNQGWLRTSEGWSLREGSDVRKRWIKSRTDGTGSGEGVCILVSTDTLESEEGKFGGTNPQVRRDDVDKGRSGKTARSSPREHFGVRKKEKPHRRGTYRSTIRVGRTPYLEDVPCKPGFATQHVK